MSPNYVYLDSSFKPEIVVGISRPTGLRLISMSMYNQKTGDVMSSQALGPECRMLRFSD